MTPELIAAHARSTGAIGRFCIIFSAISRVRRAGLAGWHVGGWGMKAGWEVKRLADFAATVSTGPFGSVLHKSDYVDDGVPLVNPVNIVGESIVPDPTKLIDGATKQRLGNYVLQEGDIVVGRRGEIGRFAVVGSVESGWVCGTGSFFIRPLFGHVYGVKGLL